MNLAIPTNDMELRDKTSNQEEKEVNSPPITTVKPKVTGNIKGKNPHGVQFILIQCSPTDKNLEIPMLKVSFK